MATNYRTNWDFCVHFCCIIQHERCIYRIQNDTLFKGKLLHPTAFMMSIPLQLPMIFIRLLYLEVNGYGPTVNYPKFQQIGHQIFLTVLYIFESLRIASSFGYPMDGENAGYFSNWFCVLFLIKSMQVKVDKQVMFKT